MEAKTLTFILTKTKTWSRQVRVFVMNKNKKYEERLLPFTTEHAVSSKQRNTRGHQVPAQFITSDPVIIEALYRDTAYGKDFIEKGDAEAKKKQPSIIINDNDRQLIAIRGLFKIANLPFDEALPYDVLKEQYEIHMAAMAGKSSEKAQATQIPHTPVDVKATIEQGVAAARQSYQEKYGEEIPVIVANDLAFLDALANPDFDAKKYIEEKVMAANNTEDEKEEGEKENAPAPDDKATLHNRYFEKFKTKVPNLKANDIDWIKGKLEE